MTIVEKVSKLLKKYKTLRLSDIYTPLPEHSPASIRGNMYRNMKKEDCSFFRSGKSEYTTKEVVEIVNESLNAELLLNEINTSNVISLNELRVKKIQKSKELELTYKVTNKLNNSQKCILEEVSGGTCTQYTTSFFDTASNFIQGAYNSISSMFNRVINMDAVKFLKSIPDNFVDLFVSDPPYPTISGGSSTRKGTPSGILQNNDGKIFEFNNLKFEDWIPELYRVMKDGSQGYIMTNFLNLNKLMTLCEKVGFKIHNLLVWKKNNATPSRWYMKNAEYTLFIRKGKAKPINNLGSMTVHEINNTKGKRLHPTEKPLELADYYIKNSCVPGGVFLELFAGAGAFAISALLHGMNVLACEIDKAYQKIADTRLLNAIRLGFDDRNLLFDLI